MNSPNLTTVLLPPATRRSIGGDSRRPASRSMPRRPGTASKLGKFEAHKWGGFTGRLERGLQPDIARLFIVDGAKALSRAVRDTFGGFALIQRCQVHKGRNIIERLDPSLHAGVKKVLRQAWDSPTAEQAERVLKNLARRLDHDAPGVSTSILEGLDEMLTVIRLGLPDQLRRSLGCTNAIESLMAVLRQVCRNVKRWRDARMALRWTATAMLEAEKSFRRLKAHKQLPILRAALLRHQQALPGDKLIASKNLAA